MSLNGGTNLSGLQLHLWLIFRPSCTSDSDLSLTLTQFWICNNDTPQGKSSWKHFELKTPQWKQLNLHLGHYSVWGRGGGRIFLRKYFDNARDITFARFQYEISQAKGRRTDLFPNNFWTNCSFLLFQYYHTNQCLKRDRLDPQLCLLFWSGGMPVLLGCPQVMSFLPNHLFPWIMLFLLTSASTNLSLYKLWFYHCGRLSVIRANVVEPDKPKNVGHHPNLDWQLSLYCSNWLTPLRDSQLLLI